MDVAGWLKKFTNNIPAYQSHTTGMQFGTKLIAAINLKKMFTQLICDFSIQLFQLILSVCARFKNNLLACHNPFETWQYFRVFIHNTAQEGK